MAIGTIKHGAFHKFLGKKEGAPITGSDIKKGLAAGGHAAKMANFARNAKKWHHGGKKKRDRDGEHGEKMYGAGSKSKRETSSEAKHTARQHVRGVHRGAAA
jgi:hypothetical protein